MSWLSNFLPFAQDSLGEIGQHPWQAAGAALGVPGFDPAIGGLLNNRPGGALLSPTGNFTSSAWQDMRNNNPGDASALNQFAGINSIADKVAPMIAGGYASGLLGGAGGASSLGGSGASSLGPSSIDGSGSLFGIGSGMGGSTLTGTADPALASASPYASAFGGSSMSYPFSVSAPTDAMSIPRMAVQALQMMQQRNQQPQQAGGGMAPRAGAFGNAPVHNGSIGQPTPYAQFNGAGAQPFGFGGMYV